MSVVMRQVVFTDKYKVEVIKQDLSSVKQRDVLVKNEYSLISPGTELALFMGTHIGFNDPEIAWAKYPIAAGYASVGMIVEKGEDVLHFDIGDYVMHYHVHADRCILNTDKDFCFKVPKGCDYKQALFTRFGQISFTAVAASQKQSGAVLVYGAGLIGNMCAQLYKNTTSRQVIVADLSNNRLKQVARYGLDIINPEVEDIQKRIEELTVGKGVDTIVEATGLPALVKKSLQLVNEHGEVILLGSTRGVVEIDVYKLVHRKCVNLIGAHENRYPKFGTQKSQQEFALNVLSQIHDGSLHVENFITDDITIDNIADAYQWLIEDKDNHLGIVIHW
jgi:2-desacetyl-2-hydroxyethyl bacteriochlorophyllide A dehydrogenase